MKKYLLTYSLAAIAIAIQASHADAAVSLTGTTYDENFDTDLASSSVPGVWPTVGQQAPIPGSSGWDGAQIGGTGTVMNFTVDTGSNNAGAIYNYGTSGGTDRALGMVASGTRIAGFGLEIDNNTGSTITDVTISYLGEYWRSSTSAQNIMTFAYEVGSPGSTTYLTDAGALPFSNLNLNGPQPVTGTNGALDGTQAANEISVNGVLAGVNIPVGGSLYIRWQDANDLGNDAGLAVDNFHLVATLAGGGPPPVAGDLDGNGTVDGTDYNIFLGQWLQTGGSLSADFNHDGKVNLSDFVTFKSDYQAYQAAHPGFGSGSGAALSVPEPHSIVLAASVLPLCWLLRRRSRNGVANPSV